MSFNGGKFDLYSDGGVTTSAGVKLLLKLLKIILVIKIKLKSNKNIYKYYMKDNIKSLSCRTKMTKTKLNRNIIKYYKIMKNTK